MISTINDKKGKDSKSETCKSNTKYKYATDCLHHPS